MIIAFSVIDGFLLKFVVNPVTNITFFAVDKMSEIADYRNEYMAVRELFLSVGRSIGALVFILLPSDVISMAFGILIITLSQYLTVFFCKRCILNHEQCK